jgi:hypothetical protein
VSNRQNQEVSEYERQYSDGSDPQVLDVIDIPLLEPRPRAFQQENWLLDPNTYWSKVDTLDFAHLRPFAQASGSLWLNGTSTFHGLNDKIDTSAAEQLNSSLKLIHVAELELRTFAPGANFGDGKRRVQAVFAHDGVNYRLRVTDPIYERRYLAQPDGRYRLGDCYLTVSLGEPFNNACYKLVAAILEPPSPPGGALR